MYTPNGAKESGIRLAQWNDRSTINTVHLEIFVLVLIWRYLS